LGTGLNVKYGGEIRGKFTIPNSIDLFYRRALINKNQFDSIREDGWSVAQKGDSVFQCRLFLKSYSSALDYSCYEKRTFYAVIKFMTILYELSLCR